MDKDETAKWVQAFGGSEPAVNRIDACLEGDTGRESYCIKCQRGKYGIYEKNGDPVILVLRDKLGNKTGEEIVRAGTKSAARRLAKQYGATWRKDGVVFDPKYALKGTFS